MPSPELPGPAPALQRLLLPSPVGPLLAVYDADGVRTLHFWEQGRHPPAGTRVEPTRSDEIGWRIAEELWEYFRGKRAEFDLPLTPAGTEFQRRVWDALRRIPLGETRTYGDLAAELGVRSPRAVGQANRRNPLPIVVPCHRVVAAGGGLGGYMGQGTDGAALEVKRWLLKHERECGSAGVRECGVRNGWSPA